MLIDAGLEQSENFINSPQYSRFSLFSVVEMDRDLNLYGFGLMK